MFTGTTRRALQISEISYSHPLKIHVYFSDIRDVGSHDVQCDPTFQILDTEYLA